MVERQELRRADAGGGLERSETYDRADDPKARRFEVVNGGRQLSSRGDVRRVGVLHGPGAHPYAHRDDRSGGRRMADVALLSVLDMMPMGVLVVDASRMVVRMNARAREVVSSSGALSIGTDGRCYARQGQNEGRFQQALSLTLAIGEPAGAFRFVALSDADGEAPLVAQLCSVEVGDESWAAIFLFGARAQLSASAQALRSVFSLTVAESELAVALAYGATLSEYARTRGITINTAKTQLRGALSKTATRRQSALIRLILLQLPCVSNAGAGAPWFG